MKGKSIDRFFKISRFIWNHPLASKNRFQAYLNFFGWQCTQRIHPHPAKKHFIANSVLIIEKGMVGATGNIYTGLSEFDEMAFLLHVLKSEDVFADVGANVGTYTVLAAKVCGAKSFCFEPIRSTFDALIRNLKANDIEQIVSAFQNGVGHNNISIHFTSDLDSMNRAVIGESESSTELIPLLTLDDALEGRYPQMIKIDVEGFEYNVLKGSKKILASKELKAIIIELNGSGERYGFSGNLIHNLLSGNGFEAYKYEPFKRSLTQLKSTKGDNRIYIKDINWVNNRIQNSPQFKVLGQFI